MWLLVGLLCAPAQLPAQDGFRFTDVFVNSESERYLRSLQALGEVPLRPWSVRAFSPLELERLEAEDTGHPWSERLPVRRGEGARSFRWIAPQVDLTYNSGFPQQRGYGGTGSAWLGRGATVAARAGFALEAGPLFLHMAPEVFWTQNAEFPLVLVDWAGNDEYQNPRFPDRIDYPQRIGYGSWGRVDPGQSTLGLQALGAVVGLSTAHQHWGPGQEMPLLLGTNAPGFLHLFAGTGRPVNVGIGSVHGRLLWGRLEQTQHSPMPADSAHRLMSGGVGVFTPRGIPGLELGIGRLIHEPWPEAFEAVLATRMFGGIFGESTENTVANQVASLFFRWVFPRAGLEIYGEHVREDFSYNFRDFWMNPDLNAGNMLGLQKTWRRSSTNHLVTRAEVVTVRHEIESLLGFILPVYVHGEMRQGHTHRGRILGSPAAYGGAGSAVATDYYHPRGRWTLAWIREQRGERRYRPEDGSRGSADVMHTLDLNTIFFRGQFGITAGAAGTYNLNRDFREDAFNLNFRVGGQVSLP